MNPIKKTVDSLNVLLKHLAYDAVWSALDSGDYGRYDECSDESLDFSDLWNDYWKSNYRSYFLSAFCDVEPRIRQDPALKRLSATSQKQFASALANRKACIAFLKTVKSPRRKFLSSHIFFDGTKDRPLKIYSSSEITKILQTPPTSPKLARPIQFKGPLKRGDGIPGIHIGDRYSDIVDALGRPDHTSTFKDRFFAAWLMRGILLRVDNTSEVISALYVFFDKNAFREECQFQKAKRCGVSSAKTDLKIGVASTPEAIIRAYGKPKARHEDGEGKQAFLRLEYRGIDFLFNNGKLGRISVF